jgi:hypothetical protein
VTVASRIALDAADRGSVERVRGALAASEEANHGTASTLELLGEIGRLQGQIVILLRVIDGGEQP